MGSKTNKYNFAKSGSTKSKGKKGKTVHLEATVERDGRRELRKRQYPVADRAP